jgi:hypothetical protein|eukprot:COSAG01_NODE_931_length_12617_cov_20.567163_3_plen_68_part_00
MHRYRALLLPEESESPCSPRASCDICLQPLRAAILPRLSGVTDGAVRRENQWMARTANVMVWARACA